MIMGPEPSGRHFPRSEAEDHQQSLDEAHLDMAEEEARRFADEHYRVTPEISPGNGAQQPNENGYGYGGLPDTRAKMVRAVRVTQVKNILEDSGCPAPLLVAQRLADLGLLAVPSVPGH